MTNRRLLAILGLAACLGGAAMAQNLAASFTGTGTGWVDIPDSPTLVPSTGITLEAWVYRSSNNSGGYRAVLRKNAGSFNESYSLRLNNGFLQMAVKTAANGTTGPTANVLLPTNSWHHLAGTFDNTTVRLYQDGALIATQAGITGPLVNTGSVLKIAAGDNEPWSGYLDNIRLWSVARTQQQIQSTMNYVVTSAPGLVSSWKLDNNFQDSTGANHGTPMGTVPFVPGAPLLPYLGAPTASPIGSPLVYQINNPTGSLPYILDVSVAGTSPGITVAPGVVIPLNQPWLNYETGAALSGIFVNFFGILDAAGHASPYVSVPAIPSLSGTVVSSTYVAVNPANPALIDFIAPPAQTTLAGPAPAVTSVMPSIGVTGGGTSITIAGNNFQPGATVTIGGVAASSVFVTPPLTITCVTPVGTLGPKTVTVTNPDGFSGTLMNAFTYVAPLVLTQVAPSVAAPGVAIAVTGSGIQPGATLLVGGIPVTPTSVSATQIAFTNPAGVPCNGPIQVTNPDGQTASMAFNVSPGISALIPISGIAAGGYSITIVCTNFLPGSTIQVGSTPVSPTTVGPGFLVIPMPAGLPGPTPVTLTSVNGCAGMATFTYQ